MNMGHRGAVPIQTNHACVCRRFAFTVAFSLAEALVTFEAGFVVTVGEWIPVAYLRSRFS